MPVLQPRYAPEEAARLGDEIYNRAVKPVVEPDHNGEWVMIDLDTGAWEIGEDELSAAAKMEARLPMAQVWMVRVGYGYTHRLGGGRAR